MNLQQLKSVCEIADHRLSISGAANAVLRTQSTISRQIQELEEELGIEIFDRRRNKVLGITPRGQELLTLARRIVRDTDAVKSLKKRKALSDDIRLTIATTQTQAQYTLPAIISAFTAEYPKVCFNILHATPPECYQYVHSGQADLALCSAADNSHDLVEIPWFHCGRVVVAPREHPLLLRPSPLSRADIAQYPLIVIERQYATRNSVSRTLCAAMDIRPAIVLTSGNTETCKSYVERGMGIVIIPRLAYDEHRDQGLGAADITHLYPPVTVNIIARKSATVDDVMVAFIRRLSPPVALCDVREMLAGNAVSADLTIPLR